MFGSLLAAWQVDTVEVTVVPVLPSGVPLLPAAAPRTALALTRTRATRAG